MRNRRRVQNGKKWWAAGALGVVLLLLWLWPVKVPPDQTRVMPFHQTTVSRHLIHTAGLSEGRRGRLHHPRRIQFSSQRSPVDVYVVRFGGGETDVEGMLRLTRDLEAGRPPADPLVALLGQKSGELELPKPWWPFGHVYFLVLVRGPEGNEVTLTTSYR